MCKSEAKSVKPGEVNESNFKNSSNQQNNTRKHQHFVTEVDEIAKCFKSLFHLDGEVSKTSKMVEDGPIVIELVIESSFVKFEVDTGSLIFAISSSYFGNSKVCLMLLLNKTHWRSKSYKGDIIVPRGMLDVTVSYKGNNYKLKLFVIPRDSVPIVGQWWLIELGILKSSNLNLNSIKMLTQIPTVETIVKEFSEVFSGKLGTYNRTKSTVELKEKAKPIFLKPRPVPYASREKTEEELARHVQAKILELVSLSDWATSIVPVPTSNGQI